MPVVDQWYLYNVKKTRVRVPFSSVSMAGPSAALVRRRLLSGFSTQCSPFVVLFTVGAGMSSLSSKRDSQIWRESFVPSACFDMLCVIWVSRQSMLYIGWSWMLSPLPRFSSFMSRHGCSSGVTCYKPPLDSMRLRCKTAAIAASWLRMQGTSSLLFSIFKLFFDMSLVAIDIVLLHFEELPEVLGGLKMLRLLRTASFQLFWVLWKVISQHVDLWTYFLGPGSLKESPWLY